MRKLTYICALLLVSLSSTANADGAFFATASFDYQFNSVKILEPGCTVYDDLINTNNGGNLKICTGKNPRAEFKLGYEFAFGDYENHWWLPIMQFGYKHRSNWFTGAPFNDDKFEIAQDFVFLEFKFGGLR